MALTTRPISSICAAKAAQRRVQLTAFLILTTRMILGPATPGKQRHVPDKQPLCRPIQLNSANIALRFTAKQMKTGRKRRNHEANCILLLLAFVIYAVACSMSAIPILGR